MDRHRALCRAVLAGSEILRKHPVRRVWMWRHREYRWAVGYRTAWSGQRPRSGKRPVDKTRPDMPMSERTLKRARVGKSVPGQRPGSCPDALVRCTAIAIAGPHGCGSGTARAWARAVPSENVAAEAELVRPTRPPAARDRACAWRRSCPSSALGCRDPVRLPDRAPGVRRPSRTRSPLG